MAEGGFEGFCAAGLFTAAMAASLPLVMLYRADQHTELAAQDFIKYIPRKKMLRKLERELDLDAWRWPMYARPVLYRDVDLKAQVYFSNANRSAFEARELEQIITLPPERPIAIRELLSISNNSRRVEECKNIRNNIQAFENALANIGRQLNYLRLSHNKEEGIKSATRAALGGLESRLEEIGKRVKGHSRGEKFDETVDWAQNNAQNCYIAAQDQIVCCDHDGINFAIADIFIKLANYILDHFDLYEREFAVPARFELDHFDKRHGQFRNHLDSIMRAQKVEDWPSLYFAACMLELAKLKLQQSKRSLDVFLEKQKILNDLEQEIQIVQFTKTQDETLKVEKECKNYWRPIDEDPSIWKKVLGKAPLPSTSLDDAQRLFKAEILPAIDHDAVIKQTLMRLIIDNIQKFLQDVEFAKNNTRKLTDELSIHKQAQVEANVRIGATGSTYLKVVNLAPIEPDTSPEIQQSCIACQKDFNVFQARARTVQGANFPAMLKELDAFEKICLDVELKHNLLIENWQRQSFEQVKQLINLQGEIKRLKDQRPRIEYDVTETNQKISLVVQSYSSEMESYRELRNFVSQARNVFGSAQKERMQLEKIWQEFEDARRATSTKLNEMKQTLDNHLESSKNSWEWAKKSYKKFLNSAYKSHRKIEKGLEQITDLDVTVKQAVGMCKRLEEDINQTLVDVVDKLDSIGEQQEEFSNRRFELEESTKKTTMFTITPKDSDLIRELCQNAERVSSRQGVTLALDLAQNLLAKTLSREEAVRIINNQGLYVENQNVDGNSQVINAGRDVYQYRYPPTE